tara:strand:+ start:361 stop:792 length:432 start_codon:yes stop_codon:yes gene_type:complete
MKLSSILFEGFKEDYSIINGEKYTVDWLGTADTLTDFQQALKRIPDTIESITVPVNTNNFRSSNDDKEIKPEGSWRLEVYSTVVKVLEDHKKEGNTFESIRIASYYGVKPDGSKDHPIYISINTKESREFGDFMRSGKGGPLD